MKQIPPANANPDDDLITRAAGGDRAAFSAPIDQQYEFILRVAFRWLGNAEDAEDVTQNVVIKLAQNISQFDGRSKLSSWIYRIVLNAVRDFQRQAARRSRNVAALTLVAENEVPSSQEEDVTTNEMWRAVQNLPTQQRDAVLMVYGEGLSHAECAEIMNCKEKTVSWYVHEAKKTLKGLL